VRPAAPLAARRQRVVRIGPAREGVKEGNGETRARAA